MYGEVTSETIRPIVEATSYISIQLHTWCYSVRLCPFSNYFTKNSSKNKEKESEIVLFITKLISLECQTYNKSWCTLADIWSHTLPVARAVVYVITVKLRTVASSPASIAEACGANTVAVVKTTIWTADN